MSVRTTETHVRTHVASLGYAELERLVADAVAQRVRRGFQIGHPGVAFKVDFQEATEGSPPYRVGTRATVTITEDLGPQIETRP